MKERDAHIIVLSCLFSFSFASVSLLFHSLCLPLSLPFALSSRCLPLSLSVFQATYYLNFVCNHIKYKVEFKVYKREELIGESAHNNNRVDEKKKEKLKFTVLEKVSKEVFASPNQITESYVSFHILLLFILIIRCIITYYSSYYYYCSCFSCLSFRLLLLLLLLFLLLLLAYPFFFPTFSYIKIVRCFDFPPASRFICLFLVLSPC